MKKIIILLIIIPILITSVLGVAGFYVYTNFIGTIKVSSPEDFMKITKSTGSVELQNDIDFNDSEVNLLIDFNGDFNGNGYTISGIRNLNTKIPNKFGSISTDEYATIFKSLGEDAKFYDVIFSDCKIETDVAGKFKGERYISLLCGTNNGTISNVVFNKIEVYPSNMSDNHFSTVYSSIVAGVNNGTISNITLDNCWLKTDGTNNSVSNSDLEYIGMICGLNNKIINNSILSNSVLQAYSCGGVSHANLGTIENIANISMLLFSDYENKSNDGLKKVGGLVAYNTNIIKNSYCFDTKMKVDNNANESFNVEGCYVGGLVAENSNSGTLTNCYFNGEIEVRNVNSSIAKVGGICAQNLVDLYSNFSDSYIKTGGSLTVCNDKGNAFINKSSFAIKFGEQTRLTGSATNTYGSNVWAYNVNLNSSDYKTEYYKAENKSESMDWKSLLEYKEFLTSSNYTISKFYPTLKSNIGTSYDKVNYQEFVSDFSPI